MGDKKWRFPGTPGSTSSSQVIRRETRRTDCDRRQELAIARDIRQPNPVPKLQEGRQEQILTRRRRV